jgi:hypothetical protein
MALLLARKSRMRKDVSSRERIDLGRSREIMARCASDDAGMVLSQTPQPSALFSVEVS